MVKAMAKGLAVIIGILIPSVVSQPSLEEMHGLSDFLRGGDRRLIRDTPFPGSFLRTISFCGNLDSLIATLKNAKDPKIKYYAADAIVTCLIHRPGHQEAVGMNPIFHDTVVEYLKEEPNMAAELIWAATEGNSINLNAFLERPTIEELFRVMRYYEHSVASMWSAAALMNMATSYCGTGPCVWKWNASKNSKLRPTHEIELDGLVARVQIMELQGIWNVLKDQVCSSASFHDVHGHTMPSEALSDSDSNSLVPWAMAGLIKALAIRKSSHKFLEETVPCLCMLSRSDDALERRNAWEALYHLGREGGCHADDVRLGICIDRPFRSKNGLACSEMKVPADCPNNSTGIEEDFSAKDACCVCGGGNKHPNNFVPPLDNDDL